MMKIVGLLSLHIILMCGLVVHGARILGLFPIFGKSHHRVLQPIMMTLAQAGHEVVVYSPYSLSKPMMNYTDVLLGNITTDGDTLTSFFLEKIKLPFWKCLDPFRVLKKIVFQEFMEDKNVLKLIKSNEQFDLVFTEAFTCQEFTLAFGHILKAPVVVIQTFVTHGILNSISGNALSLAYIPDICAPFSNRMTFLERLLNTFCSFRSLYIYYNYNLLELDDLIKTKISNIPPMEELFSYVSMTFVNDHITADYSQPRTPNIIPVAGIHIEDENALPTDIKNFVDEAADGVILFSLGTYVPDDLRPKEYFDMYINVFKRLRQRVLWKTRKEDFEGLPDNVSTATWMPQRDILAHPKCVLFITHGGLLSQHEAVHFGVPVVVVPQFGDQHRNARYYQQQGVGEKLDIGELSEKRMLAAIQTVVGDPRYQENMKKLSRIFRDRPQSPAESIVFWTEYVIKHGGTHLRPTSTELRWYQLLLLDTSMVMLMATFTVATVFYIIIRLAWFLWRRKTNISNHETKKIN